MRVSAATINVPVVTGMGINDKLKNNEYLHDVDNTHFNMT